MKNIKISSLIFILIAIFLLINIIGYKLLYSSLESSHEKDIKILFHDVKDRTSDLLVKLIYQYEREKPILIKKHKIVEDYISSHELNVNLDEIYHEINKGYTDKLYDIYITDKNLTIRNSTYEDDIGFNLAFAKKIFEKHKSENIIGCSFPIREIKTYKFLSYSDSYLFKNGDDRAAILQVSYTYKNISKEFVALENLIRQQPMIHEMNAYSFGHSNFVYEMFIKDAASYEHSSSALIAIQKKAEKLSRKLTTGEIKTEYLVKDGRFYRQLYMLTQSPIDKNLKIVYSILMNDDDYHKQIRLLNIIMIMIAFMGMMGIFIIVKLRNKEVRLSDQDKFIQSAMHEIKTPLSIITLNNELRQLEQGTDSYSEEIDNALKVLHNSYRSMSYIMKKDQLAYELEILDLSQIVKDRIAYFQTIAVMNDKKIIFDINSHCMVKISLIELTRLIDNSLYNAIKYSAVGSDIEVVLVNNNLSFHNQGEAIRDKEKVFHKYFRENKTVGGYGLGLNIIKNIADKYGIDIRLESDINSGTVFTYVFKCHTDDIS